MTCRRRAAWPLLSALACLALAASPAPAQEEQPPPRKIRVPQHGVQGFTRLLHQSKLQPIASLDELGKLSKAELRETVVIVFGDPTPLARMDEAGVGVAELIDKGGALLVATDSLTDRLLQDFEVQVVGDVVSQDPARAYLGVRDCPLIDRVEERHPLFQGVRRLATIMPSQVAPLGQGLFLTPLALFPDGCTTSVLRFFPGAAFVAGTDAKSDRRIVVMGGHSPFMNVLLARPDNDNRAFAVNAVNWLTDNGKRKRCFFVYNGSVAANYDIPLGGIPMPTEELINRFLAKMEGEGFFEKLAERILPRGFLLHAILYGASLFLAIYLFFRVWGRRHEIPREAPLLSAKVAQAVPDRTVLALRQQALVHEDNLWEVARALARQCFERHGVRAPGPGAVPEVRDRGRRGGSARRRRVLALWRLAHGKPGRAVRARDFGRVLADIDEVDGWLADDTLRLEFPPRPGHPRPARATPEVSNN